MPSTAERQLLEAGLRVTDGRKTILAALEAAPHSNADELWRLVRVVLPSTSVQSAHNMLGDLTAAGVIRRIEPAGSAAP